MLNKVLYIAVSCFYRGSFSWFIMENNNLDIFDLDIVYKIVLNIYFCLKNTLIITLIVCTDFYKWRNNTHCRELHIYTLKDNYIYIKI